MVAKKEKPTLKPLRLLEDEPVPNHEVDELGLLPFSKTVAEAALGTPGPFTIGVHGEWGTGKTSLLNQAKSLIDSKRDPHIATVWFNAWKYEQEDHLIIPLLLTIAKSMSLLSIRYWTYMKYSKQRLTSLKATIGLKFRSERRSLETTLSLFLLPVRLP